MKKSIKRYLFLINDVTNLLLKKEREKLSEEVAKIRHALIIILIILIISIALNVWFIVVK